MPDNIGFLSPLWLLLLPLPAVWFWYRSRQDKPWPEFLPALALRYPLRSSIDHAVETSLSSSRFRSRNRQFMLAQFGFILALSQPVYYQETLEPLPDLPPDLILLPGTPVSMVLKDYTIAGKPVSRMTMARQLLDEFVEAYSGKRIGLTLMGNPPMLWLPLTTDRNVVRQAIARLRPAMAGRLTDMGASLALVQTEYGGNQEKVIVMLTDGGLQLGRVSPQQAASTLADQGFRLYVIAMGASAEAAPDDSAGLVYEPVNLVMLQELAEKGHGKLFHARDVESFRLALQTIEKENRIKQVQNKPKQERVVYPVFLIVAGLFCLSAIAGGIRTTVSGDGT